jgi:hypothetical protein
MTFDPLNIKQPTNNITEEERREITQLFKRALMTPEGRLLIQYLKSRTIDRNTEPFPCPSSNDEMLQYWMHRRFREGQNNIVQQIITEVDKET